MSGDIKESDWKVLRELHPIALERFCERAVAELERCMADRGKTNLERFWSVVHAAGTQKKEIRRMFDDMRRSTAILMILSIRAAGLFTDEEMARFSEDARRRVLGFIESTK